MEKFIIVSANFCQSVFEKGFLQDVRHNLRHQVPVPGKKHGLTFYYEDKPLGSLWNKWNPFVTWTVINR